MEVVRHSYLELGEAARGITYPQSLVEELTVFLDQFLMWYDYCASYLVDVFSNLFESVLLAYSVQFF